MIASPGDVTEERNIIREVLAEWNDINADSKNTVLLPLGWETHSSPSMGDRPQAIINKQILEDADLLVGVFWTRIGTDTGLYSSGTIEEIEEHIATGKPAMLYFSSTPVSPDKVDPKQYEALGQFKESCKPRGLFESYSDSKDFREKFYRQLQLKLNQDDFFSSTIATNNSRGTPLNIGPSVPELSQEARNLLTEAVKSHNGDIRRLRMSGVLQILTNRKNLIPENTARARAAWEGALEELARLDFVEVSNTNRDYFRVTRKGYEMADLFKSEPVAASAPTPSN